MSDSGGPGGGPGPDVVRVLEALRRGVDPGLLRGVGSALSGGRGTVVGDEDAPGDTADDTADETPAEAPAGTGTGTGTGIGTGIGTGAGGPARMDPAFDVSDLLPRSGVVRLAVRVDVSSWGPEFWTRLQSLRHRPPPNWPSSPGPAADPDPHRVAEVVDGDGVPLVWAPGAGLVDALLRAADREERLRLLLGRADEALLACREVLGQVVHPLLAEHRRLAGRSLDALADGHLEAARALAVAVAGSAVERCLRGSHAQVQQQVLLDPDLAACGALRLRAALVPVLRQRADPAPPAADQDASGHDAAAEAIVAVLVACSALRALQELRELVETARSPAPAA